jgi:hypothetical protein
MTTPGRSTRGRGPIVSFALAVLCVALAPHPAAAQEPARIFLELAAGSLFFPDDGAATTGERFAGGAVRVQVSPRVTIGPEVSFISAERHSHFMATGNVTFDALSAANGRRRLLTPFLVAGGGLFQTREEFPIGPYSHTEGSFTMGGGLRAAIGQNFTAGFEARVGWELHFRANAFFGVQLR